MRRLVGSQAVHTEPTTFNDVGALPLPGVTGPPARIGGRGPGGCGCFSPQGHLCSNSRHRITKSGDARWAALWLLGVGVLWYKHLRLSTVLRITPATALPQSIAIVLGEAGQASRRLCWCVPSTFVSKFCWATAWLEQYQSLPRRKSCGLAFDMRGQNWSRVESVKVTQDEFTVAYQLLLEAAWNYGCSPGELYSAPACCLGGIHPLRRFPLCSQQVLQALGVAVARPCFLEPSGVELACTEAKNEAAAAVEKDHTLLWSSTLRSVHEPRRLKLTKAAKDRIRARKWPASPCPLCHLR